MKTLLTRILIALLVVAGILFFARRPSNGRDFVQGFERLAEISFIENEEGEQMVKIENVRDGSFEDGDEEYDYYSGLYNSEEIEQMWFLVEPFSKFRALAHTFFIFDFENGESVGVSIEARKEEGENYSAFRGMFREYELYYLFADERDLILRRTDFLDHDLYMYPVKTTDANLEKLFVSIAGRANELETNPAFYHTFSSSCTTTLVNHVNDVSPGKVGWWRIGQYLPGLSDKLAIDLGLLDIDEDLSIEEARARYSVKEIANSCANESDFSACVRNGIMKNE